MANNVIISKKLVELGNKASLAAHGFFVLAELDGYNAMQENLAKELKKRGWDINDKPHLETGLQDMRHFMDSVFTSTNAHYSRSYMKGNLKNWLSSISKPETAAFVTDPKNLASLEESINAAIDTLKAQYGDPFAVKYGKRSVIKAVFDSVASKMSKETPETALTKELIEVAEAARKYRAHDVWQMDFIRRTAETLEKDKQWPMRDKDNHNTTLSSEFSSRSHDAFWAKTQASIRYNLQDDTVPARKPYRAAKDFMLAHKGDISAAVKTVSAQIEQEIAAKKSAPALKP